MTAEMVETAGMVETAEMVKTGKIVVVVKMIVTVVMIVMTKKNVTIKLFSLICQMVMLPLIMNTCPTI
jgi:hypothetical protein